MYLAFLTSPFFMARCTSVKEGVARPRALHLPPRTLALILSRHTALTSSWRLLATRWPCVWWRPPCRTFLVTSPLRAGCALLSCSTHLLRARSPVAWPPDGGFGCSLLVCCGTCARWKHHCQRVCCRRRLPCGGGGTLWRPLPLRVSPCLPPLGPRAQTEVMKCGVQPHSGACICNLRLSWCCDRCSLGAW